MNTHDSREWAWAFCGHFSWCELCTEIRCKYDWLLRSLCCCAIHLSFVLSSLLEGDAFMVLVDLLLTKIWSLSTAIDFTHVAKPTFLQFRDKTATCKPPPPPKPSGFTHLSKLRSEVCFGFGCIGLKEASLLSVSMNLWMISFVIVNYLCYALVDCIVFHF